MIDEGYAYSNQQINKGQVGQMDSAPNQLDSTIPTHTNTDWYHTCPAMFTSLQNLTQQEQQNDTLWIDDVDLEYSNTHLQGVWPS